MSTAERKQYSTVEMAEAVKIIFAEHGPDLATVICSTYLELVERCAALEARIEKLEVRKR